jgi:hypothetical protein
MRPSIVHCLVVVCLVFVIASPVFAQASQAPKPSTTNTDLLVQKLKADKKLFVAETVGVTDEEGAKFWPIYDAYQADLMKVNDRLKKVIESYATDYNAGTMTDQKATALTAEVIGIDETVVGLKKAYFAKLKGVMPPTKIARYIQVENWIRAEINWELASSIPFVR